MTRWTITAGRYGGITREKAEGATYTPKLLADFVARELVKAAGERLGDDVIRIFDPGTGNGELLVGLAQALNGHCDLPIEVHGFETDATALSRAAQRLGEMRTHAGKIAIHLKVGDFLEYAGDFPKDEAEAPPPGYDFVIANPPYVRTQILGAARARALAASFGLKGRVDLYQAFLVAIARVLKPGGMAGIIVSNRFMTTQSGAAVRQAILEQFTPRRIWDLGDTKLFGSAVLPSVLVLEKGRRKEGKPPAAKFSSVYETAAPASEAQAKDVLAALELGGPVKLDDSRTVLVRHGILKVQENARAVWSLATAETDAWLAEVKRRQWGTFGDLGRIRVGVKTCADRIFIRNDWSALPAKERPELLRPLTTHHIAQRYRARNAEKNWEILYPHESCDGRRMAADLKRFPKTRNYLERHRAALSSRTYVSEAGRKWYELWVPHDPALWSQPKLVFRDIAARPVFWLDLEGTVVNGDCYWLACADSARTDLLWLAAAIANSPFIEAFYDHSFHNKLYAGRRRFITQYVEQFPLPDPEKPLSRRIIANAKFIYENIATPEAAAASQENETLVSQVFGVGE